MAALKQMKDNNMASNCHLKELTYSHLYIEFTKKPDLIFLLQRIHCKRRLLCTAFHDCCEISEELK